MADLVYVPLETPLLAAARARGHAAVDGLGMLLHQAVPGFSHWGGVVPDGGRRPAPRHAGQVTGMPGTPAANLDGIRLLAPLTPAERAAAGRTLQLAPVPPRRAGAQP